MIIKIILINIIIIMNPMQVHIQKDCGEDNICIPDLRLVFSRCQLFNLKIVEQHRNYHCHHQHGNYRNLFEYSVGSDERLQIEIEIFNDGEVHVIIIVIVIIVIVISVIIIIVIVIIAIVIVIIVIVIIVIVIIVIVISYCLSSSS